MSYSNDYGMEEIVQNLDESSERKIVGGENQVFSNVTTMDSIRRSKNTTYLSEKPNRLLGEISLPLSEESNEVKHMDDNKLLEIYMEKVDKDQRDLKEDIRESERRMQKRMEDSDKRLDEKMGQIVDMICVQNQKIDKIESKIESVSKEISSGLNEYRKFMWGITISIFLAIAAMILTTIL